VALPKDKLVRLLEYITEVEKLKKRAPFTVPDDLFRVFQRELAGLPGIQYNLVAGGDDVWLRIARLTEHPPPDPDLALRPWVVVSRSVDKRPELRDEVIITRGPEPRTLRLAEFPGVVRLYERYVAERWQPWSDAEKPRRRAIRVYNQLFSIHQLMAAAGAETPVELVWGMGVARWQREGARSLIEHPLLTQSCEITLNPANFALELRPREVDTAIETDCYAELELPGVSALQAFFREHQAKAPSRPAPFDPATFEDLLKAAVAILDPAGRYVAAADAVDPAPGRTGTDADATRAEPAPGLVVGTDWVLFARPRSGHIFLEDVEALRQRLKSLVKTLPRALEKFVTPGDAAVKPRTQLTYRGLSSSSSGPNIRELYFPMPFNDEQRAIVEKLETGDGVVVQGPPGTGKTHTIANVICHFLAQGKRVLVVSKGEQALAVLQEKIPEDVRALTVSLLTSEREGMAQFERSVERIGTEIAGIDPVRKQGEIARLEGQLNQIHAQIAQLDHGIAELAERQLRDVPLPDGAVSPEALARRVAAQAERHGWLGDPLPADATPQFGDAELSALRNARLRLGPDLVYLQHSPPPPDALLPEPQLMALHRDLARIESISARVAAGELLRIVDAAPATLEAAARLREALGVIRELRGALRVPEHPWTDALRARLRDADDPAVIALGRIAGDVLAEEAARRERLARPVQAAAGLELDGDLMEALQRLAAGRAAFALPFGHREAREALAGLRVNDLPPAGAAGWKAVLEELEHRVRARSLVSAWNALAAELDIERAEGAGLEAFRRAALLASHVEPLRRLAQQGDATAAALMPRVFGPEGPTALAANDDAALARLVDSLDQHLDRERLAAASARTQAQVAALASYSGPVVDEIRRVLATDLGRASVPDADLADRWRTLRSELQRIAVLREDLALVERVAAKVAASGAPRWARRLRSEPASGEADPLAPADWLEAFRWRAARSLLDSLDGHQALRALFERRHIAERDLARTYQRLVAERAWLGVYNNAPEKVRRALAAYLTAMQAIGAGTGVRAIRHRRDARAAMAEAHPAVPCWILPQWRVSETLPPEIGLFDLVIVDEASQSDIWALPALLRGKKLLVVGDHKQVSPSAVGIPEKKIGELVERFLREQPNGALMTPDRSIYDLAKVVFAGNSVMLREHFRCVPAIIEFSNREFYQGEIRPLRLPTRSERLDPPLVDVFVRGGYRRRDVNEPEALAILAEIRAILADPTLAGRSIGVVTLLGQDQALFIDGLIQRHIEPRDILERRLRVGSPAVFQGDERDIMLVSMVLAKGERGVPNRIDFEQRFNVAASRARDRMMLFRSIEEGDVALEGLNGLLMAHFRAPFRSEPAPAASLRDCCETDFEREVFDLLTGRGYRVRPQVRVGGYRIDLVVEGVDDRRLAIECDGDRAQAGGAWAEDMARQRVLERAGWTFWRCFAASFVARHASITADLFATLERMRITPVVGDVLESSSLVASRVVDPLAEAAEAADSAAEALTAA
jgi:very-short-patch-repair endonuclease